MLEHFIATNRDEIIARCRAKVAGRLLPVPTEEEIGHGVPLFLDQLMEVLRLGIGSDPEIGKGAVRHGHELLLKGFSVSQVVHDYGDVCQSITELAIETHAHIDAAEFRTLNHCLDDAIAGAVTEYARGRDQSMLDVATTQGRERLGIFAHELRNLVNTAIVAFEVLRTGQTGVAGSTGSVLQRSLFGLRALITRSLAEVRLAQDIQNPEQVSVAEFIDELTPAATLEAHARGVRLTVTPVDRRVAVEADRHVLSAVVSNLLQNAFKFTRPQTGITLRVGSSEDRVLIEIEDECGGLPSGNPDDLFSAFEQRGADRSGLGLGLALSRRGIEANRGRISARSLPGRGCIFTVDLPRLRHPAIVTSTSTTESHPCSS
jgi:signal transduction histidine kinase